MPLSLCVLLLLAQYGCSTRSSIQRVGDRHESKALDCEIAIHEKRSAPAGFMPIGRIESHIKRNVIFGGKVQLEDEAYRELRAKACVLGGDVVVIDDYIESSVSEMSHLHVWATVFKTPDQATTSAE